MKLGEALSLRARQGQKLDDLRGRIRANVLMQEGTEAAEDAEALLEEFEKVSLEHSQLLLRIAATNSTTTVDNDNRTLLTLIHRREHLRRLRNMADSAATSATPTRDRFMRYSQTELKYVAQINVAEQRIRVDELDNEIRALDATIQEVNWKTDLL